MMRNDYFARTFASLFIFRSCIFLFRMTRSCPLENSRYDLLQEGSDEAQAMACSFELPPNAPTDASCA